MPAEPTTWIGIAALAITNAGLLVDRFLLSRRGNGKNGTSKKLCDDHTRAILALEIHRTNEEKKIDSWRKENREDHQLIFEKLDKL